eukprot:CAMPEP_0202443782 /NCGR_PEP_ID=MMETSP1360-20130828/2961_1 /ASSEMBLY_ACC=CAM_ASM_000848 /TAXON_ID=515479 /ORGANISM="Licmophora paradoxa, Strain CCMP2313" /LENGTH=928 /DNA_ID=CAMNT_0049059569 /DNA_START=20 /DNA_END=2806 /DNA_ORIENTATION=+
MRAAFIALAFSCSVDAFGIAPSILTQNGGKTCGLSATRYDTVSQPNMRRPDAFQDARQYNGFQPDARRYDGFQPSTRRQTIIAGNWKLNPSSASEAINLLKLLASNFMNHRTPQSAMDNEPEVVVFPPFPYLELALNELRGTGIKVGAQNIGLEMEGPFTGEVAPSMISSLGCDYVMLGHSERRLLYDESDVEINRKVLISLREPNLNVILCVGETLEEYENKLLSSIVDMQLKAALNGVYPGDLRRIVIAYEPVWAIGTGKVATPDQAQAAHLAVRQSLSELYGPEAAQDIRIQYGGSVKADNVDALMAMPDVDGALVGGASLTADSFTRIVDGGSSQVQPGVPQSRPKELTAREVIPCKNVLGESPVWSVRDQSLYWISAPEEEVWKWNLRDAPYRRLVGTTLGCVALKEGERDAVVLAGEKAFLSLTMSEGSGDYATGPSIICERPEQAEATRPNDGRVDRQGRMVFGMYNNYHRSGSSAGENTCSLYRLNEDLEVESLMDYKYRVSNCISFNDYGDIMYFCDTPTRKIYAFDYPTQRGGKLSNRRLVWTMPSDLPGGPDGAQVDAEGFLWVALSGAGRVVRISPNTGSIDFVVHLPVKSPTSCTFGGPDLDELFITTRGPDGGGIYRVKMPGIRGLVEPEFRVNPNIRPLNGQGVAQWSERNMYNSDMQYRNDPYYDPVGPRDRYDSYSSTGSGGRSLSPRYDSPRGSDSNSRYSSSLDPYSTPSRSSTRYSDTPAQMVPTKSSFSTPNDKSRGQQRSLVSFEQYMKQRKGKPDGPKLVSGHQNQEARGRGMKTPAYTSRSTPYDDRYEERYNRFDRFEEQGKSPNFFAPEARSKLTPAKSSFSTVNQVTHPHERSLLSFEQYMQKRRETGDAYAPQQAARGAASRRDSFTAMTQDQTSKAYRRAHSDLVTFEEYIKNRNMGQL